MDHFAGLDVSVKETSICIVDDAGKIVRKLKVASEPEALLAVLKNLAYHFKFLVSLILLAFSIYIRLKLNESPVFKRMKAEGKGSKAPLTESFLRYPNNNHLGRLPDRGGHLLPAVRRLDPLRQSGAGGIPAEESDHGPRRPVDLQLPYLRRPVVEVLRLRSRPGLPHQIRATAPQCCRLPTAAKYVALALLGATAGQGVVW